MTKLIFKELTDQIIKPKTFFTFNFCICIFSCIQKCWPDIIIKTKEGFKKQQQQQQQKRLMKGIKVFLRKKKTKTVFKIKTFHLVSYFSGKAVLIETRDPKISFGCGGHCNLCMLIGLCLFCNLNHMKSTLPDVFDELIFLYAFSFSPKSVSSSHHGISTHHVGVLNSQNQIISKWLSNPGQD